MCRRDTGLHTGDSQHSLGLLSVTAKTASSCLGRNGCVHPLPGGLEQPGPHLPGVSVAPRHSLGSFPPGFVSLKRLLKPNRKSQ